MKIWHWLNTATPSLLYFSPLSLFIFILGTIIIPYIFYCRSKQLGVFNLKYAILIGSIVIAISIIVVTLIIR